jgi:Ca2+-binding EF-hand superfamily protein
VAPAPSFSAASTASIPQKIIDHFRLQNPLVAHYSPLNSSTATMSSEKLETRLESFRSAVLESFSTSSCEYISYDTFRALLVESDLTDLANKRVFNIFDLNKTGMIDMKDFLLTMAALNFGKSSSRRLSLNSASSEQSTHCGVEGFGLGTPGNSPTGGDLNDSNHSLAHLYFSIFDISGRGYIELDQMKTAIDYILCQDHAELGPRRTDLISPRRSHDEVFDVEMLFAMIDTDGDGKIDFEKFSSFFNKLRASTI